MVLRRDFMKGLLATGGLLVEAGGQTGRRRRRSAGKIDRAALIGRHNPVARKIDPLSPLSVGNGEFAFTADVTGLQTFPAEYENAMPLCTMAQWGWHTTPHRPGLDPGSLRLNMYETHGRQVGYHTRSEGQAELFNWLRENPHRLHLGQIGLRMMTASGREAKASDLTNVEQRLNLWAGVLESSFEFEGRPVMVRTAVHPTLDVLAVAVESPLIREGKLAVRFAFPYGSPTMKAADWESPRRHKTGFILLSDNRAHLRRTLDADEYYVTVAWEGAGKFSPGAAHEFILTPDAAQTRVGFLAAFSPRPAPEELTDTRMTFSVAALAWERFWTVGGAVELAGSRDARAEELERRVVLSQYLTAIQCSGSQPPQETGLTVNSWYGKFHLEMHWWHAAHFPLWGRLPMLERSLGWYDKILPEARALARSQGYAGARWPKMVGPEGRDSPSTVGPLLVWQQPHPISYAELCYKSRPTRRTLERYRAVVFETAEFMASYAFYDPKTRRYVLGPPLIPAQENHPARETWNPTYELAYWSFGLKTAQAWRERLGLARNPLWDRVVNELSPLPERGGVYLAHENCPQTFTERNYDHPSMLAALGVLPGEGVDRETMRRTLRKALAEWKWDQTWGWDYPMTAMTAARLDEPALAVDALLMKQEKNRYLPNGHNWQRANLPCYLPGNGGLLYAVALMASGWRGSPRRHAPGFPADGSWQVRWEGLNSALTSQL
ncbi:MAG TPA: hypothetical protein VGX48_25250 [Pyrinomonadaceae bacterium]|jgi:hypothetical protein|nr:hypothetical protein [Pyrinomonadaceae bacterium]